MLIRLTLLVVYLVAFGYEMRSPQIVGRPERIPVLVEGACCGVLIGISIAKWVK